jgi:hypothetical protein
MVRGTLRGVGGWEFPEKKKGKKKKEEKKKSKAIPEKGRAGL